MLRKALHHLLNPGCTYGIGILVDQTVSGQWHRKSIAKLHPNLPRYFWIFIYTITVFLWYLAIFWLHFGLFFLQKASWVYIKKHNRSFFSIIVDILYSGLWLGVSPMNLLLLNLSEQPRKEWIKFIFYEQRLSWYTHYNRHPTTDDQFQQDFDFLTDKKEFALLLKKHELPAIPTLAFLNKGNYSTNETSKQLFAQSDLSHFFIKPISENTMRGCMEIHQDKKTQSYSAVGTTLDSRRLSLYSEQSIAEAIRQIRTKTAILVQPLLQNASYLKAIFNQEKLITLRIITKLDQPENGDFSVLFAFFEIPDQVEKHCSQWQYLHFFSRQFISWSLWYILYRCHRRLY